MGKQYLNGVLYGTGEIIKFSPEIYSKEEREVGVWTDGKPLYQKTIDFGSLPHHTSKQVAHGISNIDIIVHAFGFAKSTVNSTPIPFVNNTTVGSQVALIIDSTNVTLRTDDDRDNYTAFVTLQYTKTTDLPYSGKYTTDGTDAHHYSTSEKVVGTWINGRPIYEKTFLVDNNLRNVSTSLLSDLPIRQYCIDLYLIMWESGLSYKSYNVKYNTSTKLLSFTEDTNHYCVALVVQYTKTTD